MEFLFLKAQPNQVLLQRALYHFICKMGTTGLAQVVPHGQPDKVWCGKHFANSRLCWVLGERSGILFIPASRQPCASVVLQSRFSYDIRGLHQPLPPLPPDNQEPLPHIHRSASETIATATPICPQPEGFICSVSHSSMLLSTGR